jgi:hypothetical protein
LALESINKVQMIPTYLPTYLLYLYNTHPANHLPNKARNPRIQKESGSPAPGKKGEWNMGIEIG